MANENFEIGSTLESEFFGGNFIVPVGTIMMFAGPITQTSSAGVITTTAPDGWLLCNGQTFIQANYPILYDFLNSTTLPDMTGSYLRGATNTAGEIAGTKINTASHTHNFFHNLPDTYDANNVTNYKVRHTDAQHAHGINRSNDNINAYNAHSHNWNYASRTTAYASNAGNFVPGNSAFVAVNGHIHDTFTAAGSVGQPYDHGHNLANIDYQNKTRTHDHRNAANASNAVFGGNNTQIPPTYYINFIVKAR